MTIFAFAILGLPLFGLLAIVGGIVENTGIFIFGILGAIACGIDLYIEHKSLVKWEEECKQKIDAEKAFFQAKYKTPKVAAGHANLLMTLYSNPQEGLDSSLQFYLDESGDIVLVDYANQIATTSFHFHVVQMDNEVYSYHPAKAVYTGATVGSMVHTESAYYTEGRHSSGNGVVYCTAYQDFCTFFIEIHQYFLSDLRENKTLSSLIRKSSSSKVLTKYFGPDKDVIPLINLDSSASKMYQNAAFSAANSYDAASLLSISTSSKCLPMKICNNVANELNQLIAAIRKRQISLEDNTNLN